MIGEVIKEYLISLGVEINQPGFNEFNRTLNDTSKAISSGTGGWIKDFVAAGTIVGSAIAGITSAVTGLMVSTAKQDLEMEKLSQKMMVSKDAAVEMKNALDALGESAENIQLNPELMGRYQKLIADSRGMKPGGDFKTQMREMRDVIFEFTRLKQEATYALQWVGYYLMKHLAGPLGKAKMTFKDFNDSLIKNMPVWTSKIAGFLGHIVDIGMSFVRFLKSIGKVLYDIWDSFPKGVKIAIGALAALYAFLNMNPLMRVISLLGVALLLIEDYFGYMDGKEAAFPKVWDKLNEAIDKIKDGAGSLGEIILPLLESLLEAFFGLTSSVGSFGKASFEEFWKAVDKHGILEKFERNFNKLSDRVGKLVDSLNEGIRTVSDWFDECSRSEELKEFIDAVVELWGAALDLSDAFYDLAYTALSLLFKGFNDGQSPAKSFREMLKSVIRTIIDMIRFVSNLIKGIKDLFKLVASDDTFKKYWEMQGQLLKIFVTTVLDALSAVSKLGRALVALVSGEYALALKLTKEALGDGDKNGRTGSNIKSKEEFFAAVAEQESGGNYNAENERTGAFGKYQIMPENWSAWAKEAGLSPDSPRTPENQEIVAKFKLGQYYDEFGPEGALVAWYAGPVNGGRWRDGAPDAIGVGGHYSWDARQGKNKNEPSIREYVEQTLGRIDNYSEDNLVETETSIAPPTVHNPDVLLYGETLTKPEQVQEDFSWSKFLFDKKYFKEEFKKMIGSKPEQNEESGFINPLAFLRNSFANADPILLQGMQNSYVPAYASGDTNNTSHMAVNMGDIIVTVGGSNAPAQEIAQTTVNAFSDRAMNIFRIRSGTSQQIG